MCTIAILVDVLAGTRLAIAANRDELYARPTRAPARLERFGAGIFGGVDELSGGTWLAIRRDGRFAAVTNQRALAPAIVARSRGLVVGELCAARDMDAYVAALDPTDYASMNLVWADAGLAPRVAYLRHEGGRETHELPRGIHVLCNDVIGAAGFPHAARLAAGIAAVADRGWPAVVPELARLLGDHERVPIADTPPSHLPLELAHAMTATCIHTEHYGTRSATIAAFGSDRVVGYHHADGPPCTSPFVDGLELFA